MVQKFPEFDQYQLGELLDHNFQFVGWNGDVW